VKCFVTTDYKTSYSGNFTLSLHAKITPVTMPYSSSKVLLFRGQKPSAIDDMCGFGNGN
jgi:hypothetical protein